MRAGMLVKAFSTLKVSASVVCTTCSASIAPALHAWGSFLLKEKKNPHACGFFHHAEESLFGRAFEGQDSYE